jgi:hypothetical protein
MQVLREIWRGNAVPALGAQCQGSAEGDIPRDQRHPPGSHHASELGALEMAPYWGEYVELRADEGSPHRQNARNVHKRMTQAGFTLDHFARHAAHVVEVHESGVLRYGQ